MFINFIQLIMSARLLLLGISLFSIETEEEPTKKNPERPTDSWFLVSLSNGPAHIMVLRLEGLVRTKSTA